MNSESMECPLCMEAMDFDDVDFYPCPCRYQICRFCWFKIINEENGLCPACRKPYNSEHPASYKPRTEEEIKNRIRHTKKVCPKKTKPTTDGKEYLSEYRVLQKNLIFVVGLPMRMAEEIELLKGPEYFGKCGRVYKIVINQNQTFPGPQGTSCLSAYVTYHRNDDALRTLIDLKKLEIDGRAVKLSLGTTKYCSQFLRNRKCTKNDCMYLHEMGDLAASFTKEDMASGRHTEYENQLIQEYLVSGQSSSSVSSGPASSANSGLLLSSSTGIVSSTAASASVASGTEHKLSSSSPGSNSGSKQQTNAARSVLTPIGTDPNDASKLYSMSATVDTVGDSLAYLAASPPDLTQQHHHHMQQYAAISQQTNNSNFSSSLTSHSSPNQTDSSSLNISDTAADIDFDPISISRQGLAELIANENRFNMGAGAGGSGGYHSSAGQSPTMMLPVGCSRLRGQSSNQDYSDRLVQHMGSFSLSGGGPNNGGGGSSNGVPINGPSLSNGPTSATTPTSMLPNSSAPPPPPGFELAAAVAAAAGNNGSNSEHGGGSSADYMSQHEYFSRYNHQQQQHHNHQHQMDMSYHSQSQFPHHQQSHMHQQQHHNSMQHQHSHQQHHFQNSYPDYNSVSLYSDINQSQSSFQSPSWKNVHSAFCADPSISNNAPADLMAPVHHMRPSVYNRSHSMNEGSASIRSEWNGFSHYATNNPSNNNNTTDLNNCLN